MKFQKQENSFEYTARNDVKKVFLDTEELELVEYFKQAATLNYGLMKQGSSQTCFSIWQRKWSSYARELRIQ
jgi:hypothetical protein